MSKHAELFQLENRFINDVCRPVRAGDDVDCLVENMWRIVRKYGGAGLAANQVGSTDRVIVINVPELRVALVNPEITKRCGCTARSTEGCLSFPGQTAVVKRDMRVTLEGFTPDWQPFKMKLRGLPARVAQHEVDHLNGVTIFERSNSRT